MQTLPENTSLLDFTSSSVNLDINTLKPLLHIGNTHSYRWQRVLYPRILISQTRTREENPLPVPVPVPATRRGHQLVLVPATRGNGLPAGIRQPQETDTIQYIVQNIKQY